MLKKTTTNPEHLNTVLRLACDLAETRAHLEREVARHQYLLEEEVERSKHLREEVKVLAQWLADAEDRIRQARSFLADEGYQVDDLAFLQPKNEPSETDDPLIEE